VTAPSVPAPATAGSGASNARQHGILGHPQLIGAMSAAAGLLWYLVADPQSPDLAAQTARATVARSAGVTEWWLGWFGGLQLPSYSLLSPVTMALLSTPVVGCVAVVASVVGVADLLRGSRRPRLGAATFAVMAIADVAAGRLTFALAFAVGVLSLVALRRRHWMTVPLAVACGLVSLLAALFLGVTAVAVALTDRSRRASAIVVSVALLAEGITEQLMFPQTGLMPYGAIDIGGAAVTALGVATLVRHRTLRVGAFLMIALPLLTMVDPGAVGENVVRLAWLVAPPLVVAYAQTTRRWVVALGTVAVAIWPLTTTVEAVSAGRSPSTRPAFYRALTQALTQQLTAAGPTAVGERIEVIPTQTHWETNYLVDHFQLARGWDRQADVANNPLFYTGTLTSDRYRSWLSEMAVGWVARPRTVLDGAGAAEASLVDQGQPYLRLAWQSANWDLYRVVPATPLAHGAQVIDVTPTAVTLRFPGPGPATVQLRWTPYLIVEPVSGQPGRACASPRGAFTTITTSAAGSYTVSADFRPVIGTCELRGGG
jgi:hypothetical protein